MRQDNNENVAELDDLEIQDEMNILLSCGNH